MYRRSENWMKVGYKNKEVKTFEFSKCSRNISWIIDINYAKKWADEVIASQTSIHFVHRADKNPISQLWDCKTCLMSTLNKYKRMFTPVSFDMGTCFYMFQQTHSFAYSYGLFKKYFVKKCETILYLFLFPSNFTALLKKKKKKPSLHWINLNMDWLYSF